MQSEENVNLLASCTVKNNCFDTHSENTSNSKALYHCAILNQYAGVQNQNKEKCVAVQILMDCTAPATLLAQSPFLIRNPRQVTNTLYRLWYIGTLILRWKNRKCGADRQMGVPDNSLQSSNTPQNQSQRTDPLNCCNKTRSSLVWHLHLLMLDNRPFLTIVIHFFLFIGNLN